MSVAPVPVTPGLAVGEALIVGKAKSQRAISTAEGRRWLTVVTMAARDEFSKPAVVELRSVEKLASAAGEMVRCRVLVGGYANNYEAKNKETGEIDRISSARNSLDVI